MPLPYFAIPTPTLLAQIVAYNRRAQEVDPR